jgi:4-amino-4-deoxy-L-arabinose transferase-like glycosyltransferase
MATPRGTQVRWLAAALVTLAAAHALVFDPGEPFFNNDETRHLMTGVFFRDFFHDRDWTSPVEYATRYYLQYPALGLAVWPPLFYSILGGIMLAFGTSIGVAKLLVLLLGGLAAVYFFRLVLRTHQDPAKAALAAVLFGVTPLVFTYCSHVMLEIPTLAWSLASTFYFVRYLDEQRRRDILVAAVCAAAAALTRFDAAFLLVLFVILLAVRRQLRLLLRLEVWVAAAVAILAVLPAMAVTATQVGEAHLNAVKVGTSVHSSRFLALANLPYYPLRVPGQIAWIATAFAIIGLGAALWRKDRRSLPTWAVSWWKSPVSPCA